MSKKRAIRQDRPKSVTESQLVLCFDSSSVRHFPLVHSQAEAAIRIGADPRLEENRSTLLSVIRQGNKCASVTFLALRPLHHPRLLAADPIRSTSFRAEIIRPSNLKQRAAKRCWSATRRPSERYETDSRSQFVNYFSARTEKPRSLLHSSERLPSRTVSSTTSWPHSRWR